MGPAQIESKGPDVEPFLYRHVLTMVLRQINTGALRTGDRLPSLRKLSLQMKVSVPTVRQAYLELERQGRIEARAKSGYFVLPRSPNQVVRRMRAGGAPVKVSCRAILDEVNEGLYLPKVLPLGVANPTMALPAATTLNRAMKRVMRRAEQRLFGYAPTNGELGLRRQLAYRYLAQGGEVDPNDIVITNGAQEGLSLALQSVAKSGDIIAVESPCYHGQLELIEALGMLALEIDTCPVEGVDVAALEGALATHRVAACMLSSSINNPLGCMISEDRRKRLVDILETAAVPLIEDDVYGELAFHGSRPLPCHRFSKKGLVLTCSSFSKTVAPGYRTGWIFPGRFGPEVAKRKRAFSCSSGLLQQLTLEEFVGSGDYDRYLKRLRAVLQDNAGKMASSISRHFPSSTRLSRPQGGSVLWVEVPGVDSIQLFRRALERGISIMPGPIFSARRRYLSFMRLSYGHPWNETIERGLMVLGELLRAG